jgi:hypothetical protein
MAWDQREEELWINYGGTLSDAGFPSQMFFFAITVKRSKANIVALVKQ